MRRIVVVLTLLTLFGSVAHAEPGPIGRWLMNQPFTLWDIGMIRIEEAAEEAEWVADHLGHTSSFAFYHWNRNEIEVSFSLMLNREIEQPPLTHEFCNDTRRAFIGALTGVSFKWSREKMFDGFFRSYEENAEYIYAWIGLWFSHEQFQEDDRDDELGMKLSRIMIVRVEIVGPDMSIKCENPIMRFEAPSLPIYY